MPVKSKIQKQPGTVKSVKMEAKLFSTYRYLPAANKPDYTTSGGTSSESQVSLDMPTDFCTNSNVIDYDNNHYKRFGYCRHTKTMQGAGPPKLVFKSTTEYYEDPDLDGWDVQVPYLYKTLVDRTLTINCGSGTLGSVVFGSPINGIFLDDVDVDSKLTLLAKEAVEEMTPKLDDGFSVPVFIMDLIECRSLLESAWKLARSIPAIFDQLALTLVHGVPARFTLSGLWDQPVNKISNTYLAHQFGVLPFISDIKKIVQKYFEADQKILDFLEKENKELTYHFERKLQPTYFQPDPSFYVHPVSVDFGDPEWAFATLIPPALTMTGQYRRVVTNVEYHATMRFKYHLPNYSIGTKAFLASLDHYGVNLSISDLWEIIPFSFLVDWVFNVGASLQFLDLENLPVTLEILDFCDSLKYNDEHKVEFTGVSPQEWSPLTTTLSKRSECYHRWPGIPPASGFSDKIPPSVDTRWGVWRISILAGLAGGRIKFRF